MRIKSPNYILNSIQFQISCLLFYYTYQFHAMSKVSKHSTAQHSTARQGMYRKINGIYIYIICPSQSRPPGQTCSAPSPGARDGRRSKVCFKEKNLILEKLAAGMNYIIVGGTLYCSAAFARIKNISFVMKETRIASAQGRVQYIGYITSRRYCFGICSCSCFPVVPCSFRILFLSSLYLVFFVRD